MGNLLAQIFWQTGKYPRSSDNVGVLELPFNEKIFILGATWWMLEEIKKANEPKK
jgi:hypothetical protein